MYSFFSFNKGQQMTTTCMNMNRPIKIECEKRFLAGNIGISLEPKYLIDQQNVVQKNLLKVSSTPSVETSTYRIKVNSICWIL